MGPLLFYFWVYKRTNKKHRGESWTSLCAEHVTEPLDNWAKHSNAFLAIVAEKVKTFDDHITAVKFSEASTVVYDDCQLLVSTSGKPVTAGLRSLKARWRRTNPSIHQSIINE